MTTGTKIALAVIVLMVGLLVVYYGGSAIFGGDDSAPDNPPQLATDDPAASPDPDSNRALARDKESGQSEFDESAGTSTERTPLEDSAAPVRPVDPLMITDAQGSAFTPGALATDASRRSAFGPFNEHRQTERDRPPTSRQQTGPAVVLPELPGGGTLAPNQPANLGNRSSGVRSGAAVGNRNMPPIGGDYTVQAGDTLSSIAEDWFGNARHWDLIAKANPFVDPNRLKIGQKLRMPAKDAARVASPASTQVRSTDQYAGPSVGQYVVQSGDTLISIAQAYYGDSTFWESIFNANKSIIGGNPNRLKVGMKLTIPPAPRPAE